MSVGLGMSEVSDTLFKILDFPPELVILILRNLDCRSILQCAVTCKFLRSLTQTAEIRYLLELAYDGLIAHPSASSSANNNVHDCLAALRSRREAFKYLQWKTVSNIPIPGPCQAYELVGGVFAKSMHSGTGVVPGSQHFLFSWLPTSKGPVEAPNGGGEKSAGFDFSRSGSDRSTIVRNDIGIPTRDFAIDPTQDLIALIEHDDGPTMTSPHAIVQIHLRTLSTNVPHPGTTCPVFRHVTPFRIGNAFIQIVDDIIGLFFWAEGPGLLIWSWKDGRVCVYQTEPDLSPSAWDFAFLSSRAYMITYTGHPGSIELFTFTTETQAVWGPVLTDSAAGLNSYFAEEARAIENRTSALYTGPRKVVMLLLPPLQQTVPLINFATHTGPYLANPPQTSAPFYTDTYEQRMHVMTLRYQVDNRVFRYTMYVHNKTFLDLIRKKDGERQEMGKAKRVLEWSEWGRENTRMVACHLDFHWLRYVYGTRVVCTPERVTDAQVPGMGVLQRVKVFDFNLRPYLPRPAYLRDEEDSPIGTESASIPLSSVPMDVDSDSDASALNGDVVETSLVLEPSQIVCDPVFKEPVETMLPYRAVSRVMRVPVGGRGSWWGFSGFMLDEERLIGLKSTALSEGDMGEITVFTL